jgi:hypothetical protein
MLAALTQTPELALEDDESKALAGALVNVTKHYKIPALSPEKMALGVLVWTAGRIYGPRAMAISARKRGDTAAPASAPPSSARASTMAPQGSQAAGIPTEAWFTPPPSLATVN